MPVKKLTRDKMTFGVSDSNEDDKWKNSRNFRFANRLAKMRPRLKVLVNVSPLNARTQ